MTNKTKNNLIGDNYMNIRRNRRKNVASTKATTTFKKLMNLAWGL